MDLHFHFGRFSPFSRSSFSRMASLVLVAALGLPVSASALSSGSFSDSRWYCM